MNRNFFLAVGAVALIAAAACTTTDDDGDGGGGTGGTSTGTTAGGGGTGAGTTGGSTGTGGSVGGSGGSAACISCTEWITACADGCPEPDTICEGDSMTAYDNLAACICGECTDDCEMTCEGTGEDTGDCQTCLGDAMVGVACSADLGECTNN